MSQRHILWECRKMIHKKWDGASKGCAWKRFYHVKVSPRHSMINHLSSCCCKTAMVECKLRNKLLRLTALTALRAIYLDSGAGTNLYGTLLNACFLSFCSLSFALVTMEVYKYELKKWFNIGGCYQTIFYCFILLLVQLFQFKKALTIKFLM